MGSVRVGRYSSRPGSCGKFAAAAAPIRLRGSPFHGPGSPRHMTTKPPHLHTLELTPPGEGYATELSLSRAANGCRAAWVQRRGDGYRAAWRDIERGAVGPIGHLDPTLGTPAQPRACREMLLWCEYAEARGSLLWAPISEGSATRPRRDLRFRVAGTFMGGAVETGVQPLSS